LHKTTPSNFAQNHLSAAIVPSKKALSDRKKGDKRIKDAKVAFNLNAIIAPQT